MWRGVKTWAGQLPSSIANALTGNGTRAHCQPPQSIPSKVLSRRVKGDISYFAEIRHFSFALK
jgi:hypothetical protein